MALNNEDKKDIKTHMGKALANKVSKVTRDKNHSWAVKEKTGRVQVLSKDKKGTISSRIGTPKEYKSLPRSEDEKYERWTAEQRSPERFRRAAKGLAQKKVDEYLKK